MAAAAEEAMAVAGAVFEAAEVSDWLLLLQLHMELYRASIAC